MVVTNGIQNYAKKLSPESGGFYDSASLVHKGKPYHPAGSALGFCSKQPYLFKLSISIFLHFHFRLQHLQRKPATTRRKAPSVDKCLQDDALTSLSLEKASRKDKALASIRLNTAKANRYHRFAFTVLFFD
eukprot:gene7801-17326_t